MGKTQIERERANTKCTFRGERAGEDRHRFCGLALSRRGGGCGHRRAIGRRRWQHQVVLQVLRQAWVRRASSHQNDIRMTSAWESKAILIELHTILVQSSQVTWPNQINDKLYALYLLVQGFPVFVLRLLSLAGRVARLHENKV